MNVIWEHLKSTCSALLWTAARVQLYCEPTAARVQRYCELTAARVLRDCEPTAARFQRYCALTAARVLRYCEPTAARVRVQAQCHCSKHCAPSLSPVCHLVQGGDSLKQQNGKWQYFQCVSAAHFTQENSLGSNHVYWQ
jgi:hypothetical protein